MASLSDEKKIELRRIYLNPMTTIDWPWYKEVMDRYLKGPDAKALIDDIELHHPGGEFENAISGYKNMHTYEAEIILEKARKIINK